MGRIRRIIEGCEWEKIGDLNADDVEGFILEYQEEVDLSNRTYNHYLQAIDSFGNWLAHPKRRIVQSNPFAGIPRRNSEVDIRHARRALTPKEFASLLKAARGSEILVQCYDGETRARIYTLSYMTGLRKGEVASLTKGSFKLRGKQPTVTVQAGDSKHRRKDVLPLHPQLVAELKVWLKDLAKDDSLFPLLAKRKAYKMVQKDLELAGIPYRTDEGVADFHAVGRHTHITELLRNGASLAEAKELARHTDVRMTMKYTHIGLEDQAEALAGLPAPWQEYGRNCAVSREQNTSLGDTTCHEAGVGQNNGSPGKTGASGVVCQSDSADAESAKGWRRRELNPRPAMHPR